jgi:hypothetical protein
VGLEAAAFVLGRGEHAKCGVAANLAKRATRTAMNAADAARKAAAEHRAASAAQRQRRHPAWTSPWRPASIAWRACANTDFSRQTSTSSAGTRLSRSCRSNEGLNTLASITAALALLTTAPVALGATHAGTINLVSSLPLGVLGAGPIPERVRASPAV